jgi:hypothetical protein
MTLSNRAMDAVSIYAACRKTVRLDLPKSEKKGMVQSPGGRRWRGLEKK